MGSLGELLRTFDLPLVFPEINSLQTAVRHVAHEYLNEAEDYGYSPDICGYVKADVATQMRGGVLPMGRIPKPAIADPHQRLQHLHQVGGDLGAHVRHPGRHARRARQPRRRTRAAGPGDPEFENDRRYVAAQIRELIPLLERVSGVRFDIDRLRENMAHANAMNRGWKRVLELNRSRPGAVQRALRRHHLPGRRERASAAPPRARATSPTWSRRWSTRARDGIGTLTEEKYRLLFVGVPCYPIFRRFTEMFTELGGSFVNSTYLWFASGGSNTGFECHLDDPIEGLAEGLLVGVRDAMDSMFFHTQSAARRWSHDYAGRRRRVPPDQELPHGVDRAGRQPARADAGCATSRACSSSRT